MPPADGIETHYIDAFGKRHDSPEPALAAIRHAMGLTAGEPRERDANPPAAPR